jgi:hypothetical protein
MKIKIREKIKAPKIPKFDKISEKLLAGVLVLNCQKFLDLKREKSSKKVAGPEPKIAFLKEEIEL